MLERKRVSSGTIDLRAYDDHLCANAKFSAAEIDRGHKGVGAEDSKKSSLVKTAGIDARAKLQYIAPSFALRAQTSG